jgi:hypothetical protein
MLKPATKKWIFFGLPFVLLLLFIGDRFAVIPYRVNPLPHDMYVNYCDGFFAAGDYARGVFAAGRFAIGIVAAGTFSVGIVSVGLFSIGIFSMGVFSIGFYSVGIFLLAYYKDTPFNKNIRDKGPGNEPPDQANQ